MRPLVLALLTAACLVAIAPTGQAATPAAVEAKPVRALIIFDKSSKNPWDSRIIWKAYRGKVLIERETWRAGSGFGGKHTRNACVRNRGWLPNGVYSLVQHDNYWGAKIKGRAFRLADKRCHDGTWRTELFIHTEQGDANTQCRDVKGDQLCRWEWPRINDYRSAGCIKMSPRDLKDLVGHYQRFSDAGTHHALRRVQVRVRS